MAKLNISTKAAKITQYRNLSLMVLVISIILASVYWLMHSNNKTKDAEHIHVNAFVSPIKHVQPQQYWQEHMEHKITTQEQQLTDLKQDITTLKSHPGTTQKPHYEVLQKQIDDLQKTVEHLNHSLVTPTNPHALTATPNTTPTGIDSDELHLKPSSNTLPQKNPDSFVPAGTFAEAVMLGAADASAGVASTANPSPMLFRITANGTLPNHRESHLKDCVVTAAVVGDVSSERGEIRLERLSCTFDNDEIVEQPVEGTVFGMDAKNGVRGHPLWREGALLERAAVAGTLSGLANGISQKYITNSISPLGATQTVTGQDIFKYGAAQGASSAMERLADYNIQRAEQYHPVIQLSAGQTVDVVFLKGFYLDGRGHDTNSNHEDAPPELFSHQQPNDQLTLSEPQLLKLKQHERELGLIHSQQSGISL